MLLLLAAVNAVLLHRLIRRYKALADPTRQENDSPPSFLSKLVAPLVKTIDRPWRLYIVGLLLGLALDTATEIGVLTLSVISASVQGWYCLFLPLLFTAGMCLIDLLNGVVMLRIYSFNQSSERRRQLIYSIALTTLSIIFAFLTGLIGLFTVLPEVSPSLIGPFWDFWAALGEQSEIIGYIFLGMFITTFVVFFACYALFGARPTGSNERLEELETCVEEERRNED